MGGMASSYACNTGCHWTLHWLPRRRIFYGTTLLGCWPWPRRSDLEAVARGDPPPGLIPITSLSAQVSMMLPVELGFGEPTSEKWAHQTLFEAIAFHKSSENGRIQTDATQQYRLMIVGNGRLDTARKRTDYPIRAAAHHRGLLPARGGHQTSCICGDSQYDSH